MFISLHRELSSSYMLNSLNAREWVGYLISTHAFQSAYIILKNDTLKTLNKTYPMPSIASFLTCYLILATWVLLPWIESNPEKETIAYKQRGSSSIIVHKEANIYDIYIPMHML